jgi:hypothetical protein
MPRRIASIDVLIVTPERRRGWPEQIRPRQNISLAENERTSTAYFGGAS